MDTRATIYAPASGAGAAAVALIRLSGPATAAALGALTAGAPLPAPRRAAVRRLADAAGLALDEALVLWFPGPASYTGEDCGELHVHGGPAVIEGVLGALAALDGLRPAEPGEFTRRAFEAGRLDLTAAEAVGDLVAARTPAQARLALRQLDGGLADLYEGWRARLVAALGRAEAEIDFSDEELPDGLRAGVLDEISAIDAEIAQHLDDSRRGERIREGFRIAILGPPNVGKSSLLNRLARREAAIVSATAGTTRDAIEVQMNLAGYAVALIDTAGLRESADEVEREGVRRALAAGEAAGLRLRVEDAASPPDVTGVTGAGGMAAGANATNATGSGGVFAGAAGAGPDILVVANKADLDPAGGPAGRDAAGRFRVSALTGDGVPALLEALGTAVAARLSGSEAPVLTRIRHRAALDDARAALARARDAGLPELFAEDLRLAARALGRITGRVDVDEVLDVVFREFCIGK